MRRRTILWALAVANAVLLVGLAWKMGGENYAQAQARGRGEYLMVPGRLSNAPNGVMYMVDTRNGVLSAFIYDHNRQEINTMAPINLQRVFEAGAGVGPGPGPKKLPGRP